MSRRVVAIAVCLVAGGLARCTFDGLDDYSRGSLDAAFDVGDSGADVVVDVNPACSKCTDAQACVQGKCETCTPTWTATHASTWAAGESYDPSSSTLFVTGNRTVGDASPGYAAFVDTCTGKIEGTADPPMIGATTLGALGTSAPAGSTLFVSATAPQTASGAYATLDIASHTFEALYTSPKFSTHVDEIWQMVPANGHLWMSGSMQTDVQSSPVVVKSDGAGSACWTALSYPGALGRTMAASAADVYMVVASNDIRVAHFDESSCPTTTPCTCSPSWVSSTFTITGDAQPMGAHRSVLLASTLYVVGWALKTSTDWSAYIAQMDLASHSWGPSYTYDLSGTIEAFVDVVTDGTKLYVAALSNYDGSNYATGKAHVFELPIPLVASATPAIVDVPGLHIGWTLDVDATGMMVTGMSAGQTTDGRSVRCTKTSCPP